MVLEKEQAPHLHVVVVTELGKLVHFVERICFSMSRQDQILPLGQDHVLGAVNIQREIKDQLIGQKKFAICAVMS